MSAILRLLSQMRFKSADGEGARNLRRPGKRDLNAEGNGRNFALVKWRGLLGLIPLMPGITKVS